MGRSGATLPSGTVTFLFSDIEGSTALARALGDGYADLVEHHHRVLRAVWGASAGVEVGTEGDAFFVAFADAADALRTAVAAQRALAATAWPTDLPVRVRIGLHTGYATPRNGDYAALAANQAARVVDTAHGGQVVASADTVAAAGGAPEECEVVAAGRFRVRDFPSPLLLYLVQASDLPVVDLPLRARPADGHNLLRPPTALHGRVADVDDLRARLGPGRLVTVTGPGGIGKTRLAVEVGLTSVDGWDDGVWFVDLAAATRAAQVDEAVADAVGATPVPGQPVRLDVIDHLRDRRALLVLDNCEHVAPGPASLADDLRRACPAVGVLATSRTPLALRGEDAVPLGPLPAGGADSPAVALFRERVGHTDDDDAVVAELCAALDGIPLAIELAANSARVFGADAVLARVRDSVAFLRSGDPTLPDRQRTLDAVLAWSLDLLDDGPTDLLPVLACFAGSFAPATVLDLRGAGALDDLAALVDHSLVLRATAAGAPRRFRLPHTVRTAVLDRTAGARVAEEARRVAVALVGELGPEAATDWAWVRRMDAELDNVRGLVARLGDDEPELADLLVTAVGLYFDRIGAFATGVAELRLRAIRSAPPGVARVALLGALADLQLRVNDLDGAAATVAEARTVQERCGPPPWDDGMVDRTVAELALKRNDVASAVERLEKALGRAVSPRGRARLLSALGIARAVGGDLDGAIDAFSRELVEIDVADLDIYRMTTSGNLAEALLQSGRVAEAAAHQQRALVLARERANRVMISFSVLVAARIADDLDDVERIQLQGAGAAGLDAAGFALYDADREEMDRVAELARQILGAAAVERARLTGAERGLDWAADRAAEVLERLASA